ncbi:MAG: 4-hydroxybenzoate transporter [Gammaproteobacteria bacterium]|jgi:AAHS family 4-hydroxybenzoate transporter-like MFS transporter|nr:4-hydroxybenzoate transporter [Gammaproteobacteria bacterium]
MRFDIEKLMDGSRLSPMHVRVLILCGLAAFLDGYDVAVMASATPSVAAAWHIRPGDLRWIVTAAVIGIAASALIVSPLGDYFGRRVLLLTSFAVVGVATLMASTANSENELFVWRLLTGIGLGASLPNALALGAEYAPAKSRTALVALLACGISLGSATSGLVAPPILDLGGWRALFITGGLVALLAWLPLFALPESLRFLTARRRSPEKIGRLLEKLNGNYKYAPGHTFTLPEQTSSGKLSVSYLLTPRLASATLLLWLVFFLNLGLLYLMSTWLSTLLNEDGLPLAQALRTAAMFQIGGVVGGFGLAWLMQRWGPYLVLSVSYTLTAGALAMLGTHVSNPVLLVLLILVTGNGINGGQVALNAVSATLYPTAARATGVGWALGVGRFGAIVGPFAAGSLMAAGIKLGHLFWLAIIPTLICAIAVTLLRLAVNRSAESTTPIGSTNPQT